MKRILTLLAALLAYSAAGAQNIDEILSQISDNNLTLKALQQQVDAQGDANLAESSLEGPEIEFGYLFGDDGRRRHDFGVSQSIDFGTLTGARRKAALGQNELLRLEYRASRRDVLTSARKLVYQIIHRNALIAEYGQRVENARTVERAYRSGYEKGEFSVIDYRKAAVSLAEAEGNLKLLEVERDGMLAELRNLNGGIEISVTTCEQETLLLPASFEQWLDEASSRSSALNYRGVIQKQRVELCPLLDRSIRAAAQAEPQRGAPQPLDRLQVGSSSRRGIQGRVGGHEHPALVGRQEDFQREEAAGGRPHSRAGRSGAVPHQRRESLRQGHETCRVSCGSCGCC